MINLLPENEKKEISREYRFRRLALVLISMICLSVSAAVFLLPSFILSWYKAQGDGYADSGANAKPDAEASSLLARSETAKQLSAILKPEDYALPSSFIDTLIRNKTSQNKINSISYSRDQTGAINVSVNGVSDSRQALVSFTNRLGKEPGIGKINIPVSNFTKDADISFSFSLSIPGIAAPKSKK